MRIPKSLKIGGHRIKIVVRKLGGNLDGEFDSGKNTISIDQDCAQSQKEVTLFHEMLHAMNSTWGDRETSHMLLDSIAEQLYQVLSDNKMLK